MNVKRVVASLLLALLVMSGMAGPAAADHLHVLLLGNGQCVILAEHGAERFVQLPHADDFDANRRHPLHVNVHLGEPGTRHDAQVIWVKGSQGDLDNCDGYING